MNLSILYRGPLSSCNYACGYCPFAKRQESFEQLAGDRHSLDRFVEWIGGRSSDSIGVLFTPWGEALVRSWYQSALARLTGMPNVRKAAIQTNLTCKLGWIDGCDVSKLALWCTFHPGETSLEKFVDRCLELRERNVNFSVGVVGLNEHREAIEELRRRLPSDVYVWINAYKREPDYYTSEMIEQLSAIDPLFPLNNERHASRGQACDAGRSAISVDGEGNVRRCHFVRDIIGNIYLPDFEACLQERPCPNENCGCHIGYVHLRRLELGTVFGERILERIPLPQYLPQLRSVS